jgi:hypothetical protein
MRRLIDWWMLLLRLRLASNAQEEPQDAWGDPRAKGTCLLPAYLRFDTTSTSAQLKLD